FGADALLGKVAAERRGHLLGAGVTHVPIGDRLEVARGLARRQVDDLRELGGIGSGHRRILPAVGRAGPGRWLPYARVRGTMCPREEGGGPACMNSVRPSR